MKVFGVGKSKSKGQLTVSASVNISRKQGARLPVPTRSKIAVSFLAIAATCSPVMADGGFSSTYHAPGAQGGYPVTTNAQPVGSYVQPPVASTTSSGAPAIAQATAANAASRLGPEGSLNFSTPIDRSYARGPFSMAGAKRFNNSQDWNALLSYSRAWSEVAPTNAEPWFCLGEAATHLQNYDAAVEGFRRATMYKSDEPRAWNNLSAAYCFRQQWDFAVKAVRDGEAASGSKCTAYDWYVFGNALKSLNDFAGASADYQRALQMRPNFPEATNNLGVCQYNMGNTAAARTAYNRAAKEGDRAGSNNATNLQAEAQAEQARRNAASDPNNVWNWSQKSLRAKEAEENSRRDINGNYTPRQY